ncbi:hypothetical protein HanPI659440_Chr09g0359471 [Helianthus annuus]|nr:hypothetical protein HanPI659440_Chr09g0359471 [Helianthus annuus]
MHIQRKDRIRPKKLPFPQGISSKYCAVEVHHHRHWVWSQVNQVCSCMISGTYISCCYPQ